MGVRDEPLLSRWKVRSLSHERQMERENGMKVIGHNNEFIEDELREAGGH